MKKINTLFSNAIRLWPIKRHELPKFLPLILLKFLVSTIYTTITCIKDTLIVTANQSGAEVIPVLKAAFVFPCSILFAAIYAKLSNHLKRSTMFYGVIWFFMVIFFLYGFILYPHSDALTPCKSAAWLSSFLGESYAHWIAVYYNWAHALFFIIAEMWGQIAIFLLFWGCANQICTINEAKRSYTLFIAAGNIGAIAIGPLSAYYVSKFASQGFAPVLQSLLIYVLICGILMCVTYRWMDRMVLKEKVMTQLEQTDRKRLGLNLVQSIKHIFSSKHLLCIAGMVIACALTINIVEITWKARVKLLYPDPGQYQEFYAQAISWVGIVSFILVFFGGWLLRRFSWRLSALISPLIIGLTGGIFFLLSYFYSTLGTTFSLFVTSPLLFIVFFGAFQNILSKVAKYSFFDSTKEIAYIPLDQESKVKGKAAVDVIGSRLGKSCSSWVHLGMLTLAGSSSVLTITPYLLPVLLGASLIWVYCALYISRQIEGKEEVTDEGSRVELKI